ncbi:MAG: FAD-dependent oxidoreductase [Hyphomicrobiaceae bacterium]
MSAGADNSDMVVVGGGMAGLAAGARGAELGLRVTVLEKGADPRYPANARWSGGVYHVGYNDVRKSPEELRAVIDRTTAGAAEKAQAEAFAANAGRLVEWMREGGASFTGTKVDWQQFILAPMRAMRAGLDWEDRGPDQLFRRMTERITSRGGRLVLGARARELVVEGGRCTGVVADVGGKRETFAARAVVIADGGFQADLPRLGRHITRHPERIKQRGAATGTGDGIAMAEAAGAATAGLDLFYGHLLSRDALTNDRVWPYPELDAIATAGILVDASGRRFADEGVGGVALTNLLAKADDPLGATIVFDAAIWEGPGRSARIPANPTLPEAGGTVHAAPTLEALATKAGLPAAALAQTVRAYNDALAAGALERLGPPRSSAKARPMPIATAPFHAIPVVAGITYTMGGILIDGETRVLRPDGSIIEGLHAAGSTTGGLEGGPPVGYLGGLAKAGVQGLLAAESIARRTGARS